MENVLLAVIALAAASISISQILFNLRYRREKFIRSYVFPSSLLATLYKQHPHLTEKDYFLVARALREFFLIRLRAGNRFIGMPSRVVDDLWHEFILRTREYERFCQSAFGRFFHHFPATATPKGADMSEALRLTWRFACLEENINPGNATRLPLLFAIDAKLQIVDGFHYKTKNPTRDTTDNRCDSGCGGYACSGGGSGSGSCGDGHSGGDGGCGGGCGGD